MSQDTNIGGPRDRFPTTQYTAVAMAGSERAVERERGQALLAAVYWKPIYKYIRLKWRKDNEDAKDLTQEFFARIVEGNAFRNFDPAKARFRTYMRMCVDGFVSNANKAAGRQKRGGEAVHIRFDFSAAEEELRLIELPAENAVDKFFDTEWVRSLFTLALDEMRQSYAERDKNTHYSIFERCDIESGGENRPSYQALAEEFEVSLSNVTNWLAAARRDFRRICLAKLQALCASDREFRDEARWLFGEAGQ